MDQQLLLGDRQPPLGGLCVLVQQWCMVTVQIGGVGRRWRVTMWASCVRARARREDVHKRVLWCNKGGILRAVPVPCPRCAQSWYRTMPNLHSSA